jgi:hypothetical protein
MSANGGVLLVYRPQGQRYNSQYVLTSTHTVVTCLLTVVTGFPIKGLECSTVKKNIGAAFNINTSKAHYDDIYKSAL